MSPKDWVFLIESNNLNYCNCKSLEVTLKGAT